jgi:hypothetical protein
MPDMRARVRLSQLHRELQEAGFECDGLPYRRLWLAAVEGRFPAVQLNGLWHIDRANVPAIAAVYGLRRKTGAHRVA